MSQIYASFDALRPTGWDSDMSTNDVVLASKSCRKTALLVGLSSGLSYLPPFVERINWPFVADKTEGLRYASCSDRTRHPSAQVASLVSTSGHLLEPLKVHYSTYLQWRVPSVTASLLVSWAPSSIPLQRVA